MSELLKGIAKELSAYVLEELQRQRQGDEWIDQYRSPLCLPGQDASRRHCAIVKRRIRQNLPGAFVSPDGKQYFLTTSALAEECSPEPRPIVKAAPETSETIEFEAEEQTCIMRLVRRER